MSLRDELVAAVKARMERVATIHDLSPVMESAALVDAERLAALLHDDDVPARHLLGWLHWYRYQALPDGEDREDLAAALAMFTPCLIAGVSPLPEPLLPLLADQADEPAGQLYQEAVGSGDGKLILLAAALWQRVADATPDGDPDRPRRLGNLGSALRARFDHTGALTDLDTAIAACQAAADRAPDHDQVRATLFTNLGNALHARFEAAGKLTDLDASITALQAGVDASGDGQPEREQLLATLAHSLWLRSQRTGVLADLDAAIAALRSAVATPGGDSRMRHLDNLGRAFYGRFARTKAMTDLDASIEAFQAAAAAAPADDPGRAVILASLGAALGDRLGHTRDQADLDAAIEALRAAADATPASDPSRPDRLVNLATALFHRFDRAKSLADLDAAIGLFQAAADAAPADGPSHEAIVAKLTAARRARAERLALLAEDERAAAGLGGLLGTELSGALRGLIGSFADLDAAVNHFHAEVDATADGDPGRPAYLAGLAHALHIRYRRAGSPDDLDAAIRAMWDWLTAAPAASPFRAGQHSVLADALLDRYPWSGDLADLDGAITEFRAAAADVPGAEWLGVPPDVFRMLCMSGLSRSLHTRHDHTGDLADLDAAVEAGRAAADLATGEHRAGCLSHLAVILAERSSQTGNAADLDAAVQASVSAVDAVPAGDPDRGRYLSNRGLVRWRQFRRTGNLSHLDAAVTDQRAALDATPAGHEGKVACLSRLGTALCDRFARTRDPADLDAAIEASRAAVDSIPPGGAGNLAGLGQALMARFEHAGDIGDYRAAVEFHVAAVAATPDGHHGKVHYTSSLAAVLLAGRHTKDPAVLDTVITALQAAAAAAPAGSPHRAAQLNNLGHALRDRSELTGDQEDLDRAVAALRSAVETTDVGDPSRASCLTSLGLALMDRFASAGNLADVGVAIETLRAAVAATPDDDARQAGRLCILGGALHARFERTAAAADHAEAVFAFTTAADLRTATPAERIRAGASAASLLTASAPDRAASLFESALALLPELALRQLGRSDQQRKMGELGGLAAEAAASVLADVRTHPGGRERAVRALRLLEGGRAVLFSQALDSRGDVSDLHAQHPDLAQRFSQLRDRLDRPEYPAIGETGTAAAWQSLRAVTERRQLASELAATLDQIRAKDGFGAFGKPPAIEELLAEATAGPIVTFNIGTTRSDALLLTADGVSSLELPGLSRAIVADKIVSFRPAVHRASDRGIPPEQRIADQRELLDVLGWLWDAAAGPVLDALGLNRAPGPGEPWPRLWWAPGGMLSLLPLHAAGHHTDREDGHPPRTVLDRAVSSYTPTIRALRYARERTRTQASADATALIVAMTATPGVPGGAPLPHAAEEAGVVRDLLTSYVLLTEPRAEGAAGVPTKAAVLARLPSCAIVHLACHGVTHFGDPSQSRLLLRDHDSDPLTVASIAPVNLERAQLAYLSACSTALTLPGELLDEAIHLTSAFQLAGFPHVVGTLWEINDAAAVEVARTFYTGLRTPGGDLNTGRAARALHYAIRTLRDDYRSTPSLWAAYVHAGA